MVDVGDTWKTLPPNGNEIGEGEASCRAAVAAVFMLDSLVVESVISLSHKVTDGARVERPEPRDRQAEASSRRPP
jgi:hypothetical protein